MSKKSEDYHENKIIYLVKIMVKNSLSLGLFSVFTVGLIALTYVFTYERIISQVRIYEAKALMEILPQNIHDNVLLDTAIMLEPSKLLSTKKQRKAFVAFRHNDPVAVILPTIAPDGYNGHIELLVGINSNGVLVGVRVVTHRETPGLGDKIETKISDWVLSFTGKSLRSLKTEAWAVKKDGGEFDQFTGATITPRAVVASVYRALEYFKENQDYLLNKDLLRKPKRQDF